MQRVRAGDKARIVGTASGHTYEVGTVVTAHCVLSPFFDSKVVVHDDVKADIVGHDDLELVKVSP